MTPIDERVFQGIKVLLDDYVEIKDSDEFVITYTPDSREPAAWVALALKQRGFEAKIVPMRPLRDQGFGERLGAALPERSKLEGRLVLLTLERDTMSHFDVFEPVLRQYDKQQIMILRIISATAEFFTKALNATPAELSALNASLLHRLQEATKVRVKTPGGSDLTIELDAEKYEWISNRGVWRPGGFTILPAGEIATYPVRVDGVLVADGAYNANIISTLNAKLADTPVRVEIANGKATDLTCDDPKLQEMFELCLESPNGRNIGEFGLGTNRGIDEFITLNSHINERRCGVHLGLGQHNQRLSRVSYMADVHLDLITDGALLWVDDETEPIDLKNLEPSTLPHPSSVGDEDITGDCCGIAYGQLQALASCLTEGAGSTTR